MKNKKGVDMALSSIVIIIVVLIVGVVLILGFTGSWADFWKKINIFSGSDDDIQTTLQACQVACAKQSTFDFCKPRLIGDVNIRGENINNPNCRELYDDPKYGGSCDINCPIPAGVPTGGEPTSLDEL